MPNNRQKQAFFKAHNKANQASGKVSKTLLKIENLLSFRVRNYIYVILKQ